ncbi:MAG: hypothetical protein FWG06_01375, partial [Clostridiales bacterium]|nr:hypothetical protein [Clostridiales bacterium]
MDIVILFAVFWIIKIIVSAVRKNAGHSQAAGQNQTGPVKPGTATTRRQQALEIQKQLRETFEAARQQANNTDDTPPYRSGPEAPHLPTDTRKKHHIDDIEEERCAEAEKVRQERRKQDLRERFGAPGQGAPHRGLQRTRAAIPAA